MNKPTKQRWKLKDLRNAAAEIRIDQWTLEPPPSQYTATAASYCRQAGVAVMTFAQMAHDHPMNALAVQLPIDSIREHFLPTLAPIRARLASLQSEGKITSVTPLSLEKIPQLQGTSNYVQKTADLVRIAAGNSLVSLDFFQLPIVPPAMIEGRPNDDLQIEGVVRVLVSASLFDSLMKDMDEIEAYEPVTESDDPEDDTSADSGD